MKKIGVIIYGYGVIGRRIAYTLYRKKTFEVMGAVDISSELWGKDLGEFFPDPKKIGIIIEKDADKILSKTKAQVVILATKSYLKDVLDQIIQCVEAGLNVVSICEELSFPWKADPEKAEKINKLAKRRGVTVVGTGINPGFLMDTLPLILTTPCLEVRSIRIVRRLDSSKRRIPFQIKVGTGLTRKEFDEKIENQEITGHVGLLESIYMIAEGLGWDLDEVVENLPAPVVNKKMVSTGLGMVQAGKVIGLSSSAYGKVKEKKVITLVFKAHAGVKEEYDEIFIHGVPNIHQKIIGGVHGDIGAVAVTVNSIPKALLASPGLKCMKDLPPCARVP